MRELHDFAKPKHLVIEDHYSFGENLKAVLTLSLCGWVILAAIALLVLAMFS